MGEKARNTWEETRHGAAVAGHSAADTARAVRAPYLQKNRVPARVRMISGLRLLQVGEDIKYGVASMKV
jgi:hypothetical protein